MKRQSDAPNPVTVPYLLALCEQVGGQRAASRLLRVNERTLRRWVSGDSECPWCAAELLRRLAKEIEDQKPKTLIAKQHLMKFRCPECNSPLGVPNPSCAADDPDHLPEGSSEKQAKDHLEAVLQGAK
jgi:uncharacterized protein with PIN domain